MEKPAYLSFLESPAGWVEIRADETGLYSVYFLNEAPDLNTAVPNHLTETAKTELQEYFEGRRRTFSVPLHPSGTDFQRSVWEQLSLLPFGKTASYLDISKNLGDPNLTRAVGAANGRNPISIIVPCHRVIGTDGTLTGYAGGLHRKKWLLQHEGILTQGELF